MVEVHKPNHLYTHHINAPTAQFPATVSGSLTMPAYPPSLSFFFLPQDLQARHTFQGTTEWNGAMAKMAHFTQKYHVRTLSLTCTVRIRHREWQTFEPTGSHTPQSRFSNVYYHFNICCVWLRCPWFVPMLLEVLAELFSQLDPSHKWTEQRLSNSNIMSCNVVIIL